MRWQCSSEARRPMVSFAALRRTLWAGHKVFLPLYSALVGPQLEYCVQYWEPRTRETVCKGANCNTGTSRWTWGKIIYWGWQSTGIGCLQRLWIPFSRDVENPSRTDLVRPAQAGGRLDLQRSFPTSTTQNKCYYKYIYIHICMYIINIYK